jgi:hypothetical protein
MLGRTIRRRRYLQAVGCDTAEVALVTNNLFSPSFDEPSRFVDPLRAMIGVKFSF